MDPIIETEGNEITVHCPFCGDTVYRRGSAPGAELSCGIAFGLHLTSCRKNPDYKETDMDRLLKDIFGDREAK